MINFLMSDALAQGSEVANQAGFSPASFVPLIAIFVIFYFLIIRPQTKKIKEHEQMINNLKIGNKVITSGGIVGVIRGINDKNNQIEIEIADNVIISVIKNNVSELEKPIKEKAIDNHKNSAKKTAKKNS